MAADFYDRIGAGYDAIIDWDERLEREAPFYRAIFERHAVRTLLDTACGTGEHAALFSSWGIDVVATDISREMLEVCRLKYGAHAMTCLKAGFGSTYAVLERRFDAVTCLGNSWPHVLDDELAVAAAEDFARLVEPGGVLILQQLNYAAMRAADERLMGPQSRLIDGHETLFLRIFDLDRDPLRFTIVRMTRREDGWTRDEWVTEHRVWSAAEMERLLTSAGFASVEVVGGFAGEPYHEPTSGQMILVASR